MAQWKKVLVSGSNIHVNEVTASSLTNDNLVLVGTGGALESSGLTYTGTTLDLTAASVISGSIFSGSFVGDGSGLTGLSTNLSIADGKSNTDTVDLITGTLSFVSSSGQGVDITVSDDTVTIGGVNATTSTKGVASFDSDYFVATSGNITLADSLAGAVIAIQGTTNEVDVSRTNGTVTVGLPNDVTIGNNLTVNTDLFVNGDLAVNGDLTYINTANLVIEDRYVLLASGSSTVGDSGIIFGGSTGAAQSGSALIWDGSYNSNDGRLAVVNELASSATGDQIPNYHIAGVFEGTEASAATAQADHSGNIRIEEGEIYIFA